ncbi:hypothetical protein Ccrd_012041 [Cynara cardunculus var. scolymus]|uniref:FAD synthase n=1 Tax=Cynara cardunculus var. scolymus TaxID=59895 RepID=A0A103YI80_CYNCS|nr:hypothetical protein Ccrd_012041 [Cynara cardunculus var. scolymus]
MEIDKAIRESDDRRLKAKYNNAIYVIQRALALYSIEEVAFSFNGGKDSTVLLHLLRAGHFLHQVEYGHSNGDLSDREFTFPIRTIYFESPSAFPEISSFTYETADSYGVQLDILRQDFKSGLEALLKAKPIRAIFLGVRIGDPTAVGQEQFSPSSSGWPPFMRVNPILDWSYRDVWAFLLTCKVQYCGLYDQGYTSIGSIHDTVPNALLCIKDSAVGKQKFRPAYMLSDGRLERAGRARKSSLIAGRVPAVSNGLKCVEPNQSSLSFGIIEDQLGPSLCRKLHSIGWLVSQIAIVQNDVDSVAEEVERRKSMSDMVPDEEYKEYLSQLFGDKYTGDHNEMARLPEGITELLQHEKLPVPLIMCHNVIVLSATNVDELDVQWDALIDSRSTSLLTSLGPFVSKHLTTSLTDIEVAQPLSKISVEFPDIYIGCYRKSRTGPLAITFEGKDQEKVEAAMEAISLKLSSVVKQISL